MGIKKGNKLVQVTLTEFHQSKLNALCMRSGLTKTQVIQRLIEGLEINQLMEPPKESPIK